MSGRKELAVALCPAGTVIHIGGLPFMLAADVNIKGHPDNIIGARDHLGLALFPYFAAPLPYFADQNE